MKWYEKFKVGQEVRVVRKTAKWRFDNWEGCGLSGRGAEWTGDMDKTIGKVYEIIEINTDVGYKLATMKDTHYEYNYFYPIESLACIVGRQLEFAFMNN